MWKSEKMLTRYDFFDISLPKNTVEKTPEVMGENVENPTCDTAF